MARKRRRGANGQPWYRKARDCWCVPGDPKKAPLRDERGQVIRGEGGRAAAAKAHARLVAAAPAGEPAALGADNELRVVFDRFLVSMTRRDPPAQDRTVAEYARYYRDLCGHWKARLGRHVLVRDLKPLHVQEWFDAHPRWGPSTRRVAGIAVKAALNWAAAPGKGGELIPKNPLQGLELPRMRKRSAVVVHDAATVRRVLDAVRRSEADHDVLTVLFATGTRPVNLARATAANLDAHRGAMVFDAHNTPPGSAVHKTAKKTGRALIVYLSDDALAVCRKLALRHPAGPLFRTPTGLSWHGRRLQMMVHRVAEKLGLKGKLIAYSARHTKATLMLEAGVPIETVAAFLGNTITQVHDAYSHVLRNAGKFRALANQHAV